MMNQLRKMQQEMAKAQDEIQTATVDGAAGGGAVKLTMSGDFRVTKVSLDKSAVDPDDVETLEDLIIAAFNDARAKAEEFAAKRMGAVTGGLKIPGM
ncbi:MAG: YbaB/EbfC family nucleoid-associated protein [Candidatus Eremiobacteraeota bacterium]|nr:YbaB/EbfC family nucleoid-associated protein [Candidatus Eremiobacteraeota bacterium]MBV8371057.1 YbaB/EbfC family nucleoid-associated protein [Candidatus Eremiobacteraeota bacterium]